ncbi:hypothetical protein NQ317_008684, partial [Molorchus minor]
MLKHGEKEEVNNPEVDLKLNGDKINLEARPSSKLSTASSRCSLLTKCFSRPASALPGLNLEDKEGSGNESKRPFSAGYVPTKSKYFSNDYFHDSLESIEDFTICKYLERHVTRTCEVLEKTLDPRILWRPAKTSPNILRKAKITPARKAVHYLPRNIYKMETMQRFPTKLQAEIRSYSFQSAGLVPGLTSKPPLPRKPDSSNVNFPGRDFHSDTEINHDKGLDAISAYLTIKYSSDFKDVDHVQDKHYKPLGKVDDDYFEKLSREKNGIQTPTEEINDNVDVAEKSNDGVAEENHSFPRH